MATKTFADTQGEILRLDEFITKAGGKIEKQTRATRCSTLHFVTKKGERFRVLIEGMGEKAG